MFSLKRLFAHPSKLIFLGVFALVVAANHSFLFVTPWHEDGDFAVNALQIERAGHFDEIYGNYSRFHFNHPGPAFFYVYAAGEVVFLDWLQVVPSPHNAHALTGLILQIGFFATALGIAASWISSRWFIPIALLLAGIHFTLAGNTFTSIWPPHVLLMPFLCFMVAGASTAAGRARHLPLTVLCGCLLVHGHVAQPLFVVLLFLLVYSGFTLRNRKIGENWFALLHRHQVAHWSALICILVFVTPLVIDLFAGSKSNLVSIFRYLLAGDESHKSLLQSIVYALTFFGYVHNQDHFLVSGSPIEFDFTGNNARWFIAWLGILGFTGYALIKLLRAGKPWQIHPFISALGLVVVCGWLITIPWGIIQTGPMFEFNGFFYYALAYGVLLLFTALLVQLLPARGASIGGMACCIGGAVIFWHGTRLPESTNSADYSWLAATKRAIEADPNPYATKFLVFDHDDWGDIAKTALALKRLTGSYRVDGNWSFMFGRYRTFKPVPPDFNLQGMSVWRFSRKNSPGRHADLEKNLKVYFDPSSLDPTHFVIDCKEGGNLGQFSLFGFTSSDGAFSWSNLPQAALWFRSPPIQRDVQITIQVEPFIPRDHISHQPMELIVNGRKVAAFDIKEKQIVSARIPLETWKSKDDITVVFSFPNAASPLELGISPDPRVIGCGFYQITFDLAPP